MASHSTEHSVEQITENDSTINIPDIKFKVADVQIELYSPREVTYKGKLCLEESTLTWLRENKGSKVLDLTHLQVLPSKHDSCIFSITGKTWRCNVRVSTEEDCSEWVKAIKNNISLIGMRRMMWDTFYDVMFSATQPSTTQVLASCRNEYRSHCTDILQRDMSGNEIQAMSKLLTSQKKTSRMKKQLENLEKQITELAMLEEEQSAERTNQTAHSTLEQMAIDVCALQSNIRKKPEEVTSNVDMLENDMREITELLDSINLSIKKSTFDLARKKSRQRRQYDFYVFNDDDQKQHLHPIVEELTEFLEHAGYVGQYKARDCPAGTDTETYHRNASMESDVVICLIGNLPDQLHPSGTHTDHILSAMKIKKDQQAEGHIIPVVCENVTDKKFKKCLQKSTLAPLLLVEFTNSMNDGWMYKIKQGFFQLPTKNKMKQKYEILLSHWCAPLLRGPLPLEKSWIDVFLQPQLSIKSVIQGKYTHNSELEKVVDIMDTFKHFGSGKHGKRMIIIGSGGIGKSTIVSHITRCWCKDHPAIKTYALAFIMPQRLINNHTEDLDRIICCDLNLLRTESMAKMRNTIKAYSHNCMFLIDGFDEISAPAKRNNTIIKLMRGEIARHAMVVVTTRPHCADEVLRIIGDTYIDVRSEGLSDETVADRAHAILTEISQQSSLDVSTIGHITDYIPSELLRIPLMLNIASYIWKCQANDLIDKDKLRKFSSMTDIFNAIWGIMIGIKVEKDRDTENVNFYRSMQDSDIPKSTWHVLKAISEISFECLGREEFIMSTENLNKHGLDAENCGQIGFINITSGAKPEGRFVHNLFMEHCAGFFIANNANALKLITDKINFGNTTLSKALGFFSNALLFAVGIKPEILEELAKCKFKIPVFSDGGLRFSDSIDMDLSFEAQLLQEASSDKARRAFCNTLINSELALPEQLIHSNRLNALGYKWIIHNFAKQIFKLLKKFHPRDVTSDGLILHGDDSIKIIADTVLLSQLHHVKILRDTRTLVVRHAKMLYDVDQSTKLTHEQVNDTLTALHLDEIDWTVDQLVRFLNHTPILHKIQELEFGLRCRLMPVLNKDTGRIGVNVRKVFMTTIGVSLGLLGSILSIMNCQTFVMKEPIVKERRSRTRTSETRNKVDQGYVKKLILWNGILCRNEGYGDERSGCVIESTTSSSETTGRVCNIQKMYVCEEFCDLALYRFLSEVGSVRSLFLGGALKRGAWWRFGPGCEIICSGKGIQSLPGVYKLNLNRFRGLRSWLDGVKAPGVKEVCVWKWSDPATEAVLRRAFPHAKVYYYGKTKPARE